MHGNEEKQTGFEIGVVVSKKEGNESFECVEFLVLEFNNVGLVIERVVGLSEEFIKVAAPLETLGRAAAELQIKKPTYIGMDLQFEWDEVEAFVRQPDGSLFSWCERFCCFTHLLYGIVNKTESVVTLMYNNKVINWKPGESLVKKLESEGIVKKVFPLHDETKRKQLMRTWALNCQCVKTKNHTHCLCIIFKRAKDYGGGVFSLAATVMSDLIHKDPTRFPVLDAADLPSAFLEAVIDGVICSAEAVACIPQRLDALCLNNKGLQDVKDCKCFEVLCKNIYFQDVCTGSFWDALGSLSAGLDELMRHASSLRGPGVDMIMEILFTISKIGHGVEAPSLSTESIGCSAPVLMETDAEESILVSTDDGEFSKMETSEQITEASPDGSLANIESFLPERINNAARLLETILHNADTCHIISL
ncbi:hypothetical protein IFM89_033067 [Coptis chinensis]|uniref:DUF913 domain-containing protein n=1 Tax=Coptis chinensis TaxID=261450 RepID=A0A835IIE6_9MAGN|nr:hypothetical protein IFM89_033067 [Coptis chinensis]